jgi:ribonuclease R
MLDSNALSQLRQLKQDIKEHKASHTGTIKAAQGRFGFVVLDDGREIYVAPEQMQRVFPDDRVEIDIVAGSEGKPSATIVNVLNSPLKKFTGQYVVRDKAHFVEPDLPRFNRWLFVPPKMRGSARHGDYVCASICQHPLADGKAQARIDRVLGNASQPGIETRYALARFQLAEQPLAATPADLTEPDAQPRSDLTGLPFVTIDGSDTLDMDDALFARETENGWQVVVAIADPTAWVKPGSAFEQAIAARATSIYLPGATIPMLPEQLANERCALQADVERLALACSIEVQRDGSIAGYEFCEARIRSRAKLDYDGVAAFLNTPAAEAAPTPWSDSLRALHAAATALRGQRQTQHVLMPERVEYRTELNAQRRIASYRREEKNAAQQLVEQCMVATNRCAADFLADTRAPFIRHQGFRTERLELVGQLIESQLPQLANTAVDELDAFVALQQILAAQTFDLPLRAIFMRSLERSQFSAAAAGHFGMGLERYITATSPIRKYNDFLTHRIIKAKLRGNTPPHFKDTLLAQLQDVGDRVRQAGKLAEQWLNCEFLLDLAGSPAKEDAGDAKSDGPALPTEIFPGEIVHVTSSGLVVRLLANGIEGFLDTRHSGEKFSFDNVHMRLTSASHRFELEQPIDVTVSAIDLKRRSINFQLAVPHDITPSVDPA